MTTHTIMISAMAAFAAVLILIAVGLALTHRRILRRRVAAGGFDARVADLTAAEARDIRAEAKA